MSESFFEHERRNFHWTVREGTCYRFARAVVNAILAVECLAAAAIAAYLIATHKQHDSSELIIASGIIVGSLIASVFAAQVWHAFFDIADATLRMCREKKE